MLLGAPFAARALAACGAADAPALPPGELIDTGMVRGHAAVRDRDARETPTPKTSRQARVVVIGAGVAGLSAAWELRRRGVRDVVVLELCDAIGGTARGGASDVTRYPWGAHYIVAPQPEQTDLIALLAEMNALEAGGAAPVVSEALRCREPEERVFYRGRWYEGLYLDAGTTVEDRRQLAVFKAEIDRWASWRDASGARAFAIPTSQSSAADDVRALDQRSFAEWLDARGLTSEPLRWLADYACRDDYTLMAADTSAWAGLFYFAARQRAAGAAAQPIVVWPDGNHRLAAHLADGAQVELGVAVQRVTELPDRVEVTAIDAGGGSFGIRADAAILAVPSFVADRLVGSPSAPAPGSAAARRDYGAWCVANVHLRARPRERSRSDAPPAWDNVFRDSPSLGYVSATHQAGRDRGATVWTWYYPFTGDAAAARRQLAGAGHADWAEAVLADLSRAHPEIRGLVDRIDVAFWGHGMIRPRVGAVWGAPRAPLAAASRIQRAHTDRSSIALFEEAFDHGLAAARAIAGRLA